MFKEKNKIILALLVIISVITFSGCARKADLKKSYKIKLEVWSLFDDRDIFDDIMINYTRSYPAVQQIDYKKLTVDTYKKELVEALASGQGPDIFLIQSAWLPMFKDKIVPAPPEILGEQKFRTNFVDVSISDFVDGGQVYAVPLSVNSLGLYYNKDLFNEAGITSPPDNWNKFVEDVKKLTKIDSVGNILQSGVAMGTAYNINRSTDILTALMLQNGTEMTDSQRTKTNFDNILTDPSNPGNDGRKFNSPGENALKFYTQFAKAGSSVYAWNPNMHYSIDAFSEGNTAMMINYSWAWDTIYSKSPKLNFDVAPLPQLPGDKPINYANYWAFAVAKNKNLDNSLANPQMAPITNDIRINESWNFLSYLTTKAEQPIAQNTGSYATKTVASDFDPAKDYLEKTKRPAARRDLIELQKNDPKIGVFAKQNLIAKSWYQVDSDAIESIFAEMIDQVNRGKFSVQEALKTASAKVSQMMMMNESKLR